jgi:hypothetical protein
MNRPEIRGAFSLLGTSSPPFSEEANHEFPSLA